MRKEQGVEKEEQEQVEEEEEEKGEQELVKEEDAEEGSTWSSWSRPQLNKNRWRIQGRMWCP